jgi:hypothetical protein
MEIDLQEGGETDPAVEALAETFHAAYTDLTASVGDSIPTFEAVKSRFRQAFNGTETKEVNQRVRTGEWGGGLVAQNGPAFNSFQFTAPL